MLRRAGGRVVRGSSTRAAAAGTRRPAYPVVVEHVGAGSRVEVGPVTGIAYDFPKPGARVAVDGRDAAHLLLRKDLRRV